MDGRPVTAAEEIALRRAAFLTVLCGSIEAWVMGQPEVLIDGELLGPLKKGLATHQANLVRTLTALGMRPDRAPKTPTLDEYLKGRPNGHGPQPSADRAQDATSIAARPIDDGGTT